MKQTIGVVYKLTTPIVAIRSPDINLARDMNLTFNQILNSKDGIMLSSKSVVNTCALIENRRSLSHIQNF